MKVNASLFFAMSLSEVHAKFSFSRGAKSLKKESRRLGGMDSMGSMGGSSSSGYSSGGSSYNANCYALDGTEADDCVICDPCNKVKPDTLTLIYNPVGQNSAYQDETKASCRMSDYPLNPPNIYVLDKSGIGQETVSPVVVGEPFTIGIGWDFDAETNFVIEGWTGGSGSGGSECFIHTSCSQPLVIGDQIGPFIITQGNECYPTTDAPVTAAPVTAPPTVPPTAPPTSPPTFLPTEPPTFPPTNPPTEPPTFPPTGPPTQPPTGPPTFPPTGPPTQPPTGPPTFPPTGPPTEPPTFPPTGPPTEPPTFPPTGPPTEPPTFPPTGPPTEPPTFPPTIPPTAPPTAPPTFPPTAPPTTMMPSISTGTEEPTTSPTVTPCIQVDKATYDCNSPISVTFTFNDPDVTPLIDDWIGIYPCNATKFYHAKVWNWACGADLPSACSGPAESGEIIFDSLPVSNLNGPHFWPVAPGCYKALILRNDGPSVPPYVPVCESTSFDITSNSQQYCS